jgi:hypothetical protein
MNNHLNPLQKTPLRQYFAKTFILQGFQLPKNAIFSPFLPYFFPILEALPPSHITKKRRNPYIFYVLAPCYFFLKKADNPLILYIFISLYLAKNQFSLFLPFSFFRKLGPIPINL